ncbi:MAG: ATP-dependent Clp protease ATP-binding subunit [Chthonomonadales bacterium]|nr:ATP-dependent Clp protease ATP-binding subunit [Chthonomonadales bacterium]
MAGAADAGERLTDGARRLMLVALYHGGAEGGAPAREHWLMAVLESCGPLAEALTPGLRADEELGHARARAALAGPCARLAVRDAVRRALERAGRAGRAVADERDLAAAVLEACGFSVTSAPPGAELETSRPVRAAGPPAEQAGAPAVRPLGLLERFGRDLTRAAEAGELTTLVGRDDEVALVLETLCRRTKRNPVLVGPAGVGKTAIVEGLAARLARGQAPRALAGTRVVAVQLSALLAGASMHGQLEGRLEGLLREAAREGVLLFIDELHSIVGAGGTPGSDDVASLLKPALARGDLACIAATTDDEYRRFIEPDGALERRFQPIRVAEMTPEQVMPVLTSWRDELRRLRGVETPDPVLRVLVDFAARMLPNRSFPDKGVDLLEQCVAHAVANGREQVDLGTVDLVSRRLVGLPLSVKERLDALSARLAESGLLREADAAQFLGRLSVTMRGLDIRPSRPNAIVLLVDDACADAGRLASLVARELFGGGDRVVEIDLSHMTDAEHVTMLLGSPPAYVGYADVLPIHRLAQMPCCVLLLQGADACHEQIRQILSRALMVGHITDARSKRIFLNEAVVILTAPVEAGEARHLGFRAPAEGAVDPPNRDHLEDLVGGDLLAQCDLVCDAPGPGAPEADRAHEGLLGELAERYRAHGLTIHWGAGVTEWLRAAHIGGAERKSERLLEQRLASALIPHLDTSRGRVELLVTAVGDRLTVREVEPGGRT